MIMVIYNESILDMFAKELKINVIRRNDSEVFGDGVSSEDMVNRILMGASIPFYLDIFRKHVAEEACSSKLVIVDSDPCIPKEMKKCPVIYVTDENSACDEKIGQIPVEFQGDVQKTLRLAEEKIHNWISKFGADKDEKDYYKELYNYSIGKAPNMVRIVVVENLLTPYAAYVNVPMEEENKDYIQSKIDEIKEKGYGVFVDGDIDAKSFHIEDYYFNMLKADSLEGLYDFCDYLKERNDAFIRERQEKS